MALGAGGEVEDKRGGEGLAVISILVLVRIGFAGSWFLFASFGGVILVLCRQYKCKKPKQSS
jgi:hypothetical protein